MSGFPRYEEERTTLRAEYYEKNMLEAHRRALKSYLSLRCASGDHGCRNSGTGCLCWCHDKKWLGT